MRETYDEEEAIVLPDENLESNSVSNEEELINP